MRVIHIFFFILAVTLSNGLHAQQTKSAKSPTLIAKSELMLEVPSIASQLASGTFIAAEELNKEVNPKRWGANKAVPGKGLPKGKDPLWDQQLKSTKIQGKEPILSFTAASSGATPTDPTGAVGPNHFVNSWNSAFRIWDKEGNALTPAASLGTIFPGQTLGDPIVMYDPFADRFVVTEFYANGFLVAVSQGPDPVNDGWYTYQFPTNSFPDYPKFSLWSDGYYITANKNSYSASTSQVVYAIDRDKMLIGDPGAQMIGFPLPAIKTNGFYSPLGFNVNGSEMPPPGNAPIVYMQDDAWSGVSSDHLKIWSINVDWGTPSSSTISNPQIINTEAFDGLFDGGSFSNLPQPSGPDIDALQATIMYMAQYRRFADHNSVVFNFVVDLDGSGDLAGIRWYELRQYDDDDPWEIYQEGTFSQADGHSAFSGNMCMDVEGNIALAYTVVSTSQYPALRYTGRFSTDPLNIMTIEEESYAEGTQSDFSSRYGDYSQMTIDPTDDKTFWSIGEYFTGGSRKNQVGVFKIASSLSNDVGIVSIDSPVNGLLTDSEPVTVSIRNFGIENQSSIPVSFQVDGGEWTDEVYNGLISSNTNDQYTFEVTADLSIPGTTYQIMAKTNLGSDQNSENDTVSFFVSHLYAHDLGITNISSPVSGSYLSAGETVIVTIKNYGAITQTDFEVSYVLNGGTPVTEIVPGPIFSESEIDFTFVTTVDLSDIGNYELLSYTSLPEDADASNDNFTTSIANSLCQPTQLCVQGVGVFDFQLGSISNYTGCDPNGYGNYTDLSTDVVQGMDHNLTITTGYGDVHVRVWIDFNDNFLLEEDEIVIDDFVIAPGQTGGSYTELLPLSIPANSSLGEHIFRIKTNYDEVIPNDPCEETTFGETEDYIVNVVLETGLEPTIYPNDLRLINKGNNQFIAVLESNEESGQLIISIHNLQGQTVIQNRVTNVNGKYTYDFDMSYATSGIYLLRMGNDKFGKIKRFMVK